ncbi:putative HTH-type transcriptional regulator YttP [compost metagenome]
MAANTRDKILETALAMFNAQGVHAVGVRDIARAVGISPGNLAYHFPQKEVLVAALIEQLHTANTTQLVAPPPGPYSFEAFYRAILGVMRNQVRFRFYQVSFAELLQQSAELREREAHRNQARRDRIGLNVRRLVDGGLLDDEAVAPRFERLYEQFRIIMTTWLRAAAFMTPGHSDADAMCHYAKLAFALFEPYCTPDGLAQMQALLAGDYDAAALADLAALDRVAIA